MYFSVEYEDGTRRALRASEGVALVVQPGFTDDIEVTALSPAEFNADYTLTVKVRSPPGGPRGPPVDRGPLSKNKAALSVRSPRASCRCFM